LLNVEENAAAAQEKRRQTATLSTRSTKIPHCTRSASSNGTGGLAGFPQFHNRHHNNKARKPSKCRYGNSWLWKLLLLCSAGPQRAKEAAAVSSGALSTNFHMFYPFVRLSPGGKTE